MCHVEKHWFLTEDDTCYIVTICYMYQNTVRSLSWVDSRLLKYSVGHGTPLRLSALKAVKCREVQVSVLFRTICRESWSPFVKPQFIVGSACFCFSSGHVLNMTRGSSNFFLRKKLEERYCRKVFRRSQGSLWFLSAGGMCSNRTENLERRYREAEWTGTVWKPTWK